MKLNIILVPIFTLFIPVVIDFLQCIVFYNINTTVYPFYSWCTFGLFSIFGHYKKFCSRFLIHIFWWMFTPTLVDFDCHQPCTRVCCCFWMFIHMIVNMDEQLFIYGYTSLKSSAHFLLGLSFLYTIFIYNLDISLLSVTCFINIIFHLVTCISVLCVFRRKKF